MLQWTKTKKAEETNNVPWSKFWTADWPDWAFPISYCLQGLPGWKYIDMSFALGVFSKHLGWITETGCERCTDRCVVCRRTTDHVLITRTDSETAHDEVSCLFQRLSFLSSAFFSQLNVSLQQQVEMKFPYSQFQENSLSGLRLVLNKRRQAERVKFVLSGKRSSCPRKQGMKSKCVTLPFKRCYQQIDVFFVLKEFWTSWTWAIRRVNTYAWSKSPQIHDNGKHNWQWPILFLLWL